MKDIPIFNNIEPHSSCYFVHSYHAVFSQETKSIYTDFYGSEIVAGFQKDNLFATQFHPEKSQHVGIQILKNFLSIEKV
jgi:imidazoleglycerol phosphate synthase glutamine amidotransferase subunit HisH